MFKSIVATCLLTFSCSGTAKEKVQEESPRLESPYRANGGTNYLYGAYCLTEEEIDFERLNDLSSYATFYQFDSSIVCSVYNYVDNTHYYSYEPSDTSGFTFIYIPDTSTFDFTFNDVYENTSHSLSYNSTKTFDTVVGVRCVPQRLMLYFEQPYYFPVNSVAFEIFNSFFTQQGNAYNTVYTGWYTINSNYTYTNPVNLFGNFLVGNLLGEQLVFGSGYIGIRTFTQSGIYNFYENGAFVGNARNVYFTNVMIPRTMHTTLLSYGVFQYTPSDIHNYTFGELIFNIMDAPVYFLKSLFSFDLFGVQFYIAFMSVLTIMLICFVVRKII